LTSTCLGGGYSNQYKEKEKIALTRYDFEGSPHGRQREKTEKKIIPTKLKCLNNHPRSALKILRKFPRYSEDQAVEKQLGHSMQKSARAWKGVR